MQYATKNRIKSMFIGIFPMIMMSIIGLSAWRLSEGASISWAAPLGVSVPVLGFIMMVMALRNRARTSASLPLLHVLGLVSLVGALVLGVQETMYEPLLTTAGGYLAMALYIHWYSALGRKPSRRVVVGEAFPDVSFTTPEGETKSVASYRGHATILMFYRGNWCPLCLAQIKEIAAEYREIEALGAKVVLISPQPASHSAKLAKKMNAPMDFLVDLDAKVAAELEIDMPKGLPMGMEMFGYRQDTVLPTLVVLDAEGTVRWLDQTDNYRVRPEPETFIRVLKTFANTSSPAARVS